MPDGSDIARDIGLTLLSVLSGPASSIAAVLIRSPIQKRNEEWRIQLTRAFEHLHEQVDESNFEALKQNEEFATTVLHATKVAMFTHRKEKHEMLRNAVLNSALPDAPVDDERLVFLNLVDEFSVAHVQVLKAFRLPGIRDVFGFSLEDGEWRKNTGVGSLFDFVTASVPELDIKFDFFIQILSLLHARELIGNTHNEARNMFSRITHTPELSAFGQRFLDFIESPLDEQTTDLRPRG